MSGHTNGESRLAARGDRPVPVQLVILWQNEILLRLAVRSGQRPQAAINCLAWQSARHRSG
ncbi:Uncharacterised protein [Vibrio cholerae]|nr:Uncharacterised protein [Vibrio cholerae]